MYYEGEWEVDGLKNSYYLYRPRFSGLVFK